MENTAPTSNFQRVQALLAFFQQKDKKNKAPDFSTPFVHSLQIVSVSAEKDIVDHHSPPRIVFSFTVRPEHCNSMKNMHGGAVATLFDIATTFLQVLASSTSSTAMASSLSVSRTLAVTFVRPTPCDTDVLVECETVHSGRSLSSLRGTLRRRSDGAVLATCEHGKAQIDVPSSKI